MIDHLHLTQFKNFQETSLGLGPFTVLGEKYLGGERVWDGIRGGTREVVYSGSDPFGLRVDLRVTTQRVKPRGPHSETWKTNRAGVHVVLSSVSGKRQRVRDLVRERRVAPDHPGRGTRQLQIPVVR